MTYRQLAAWSHATFFAGYLYGRHTSWTPVVFIGALVGYSIAALVEWRSR